PSDRQKPGSRTGVTKGCSPPLVEFDAEEPPPSFVEDFPPRVPDPRDEAPEASCPTPLAAGLGRSVVPSAPVSAAPSVPSCASWCSVLSEASASAPLDPGGRGSSGTAALM